METDAFRIEEDRARRVVTLRLTRASSGNKMSAEEIPLVGKAIREAGNRKEFKLVLVRADGPDFCQGRLPDAPGKAPTTALDIRVKITQTILDVYADIRATPVPVIAVVQGEAKGFGCAFVAISPSRRRTRPSPFPRWIIICRRRWRCRRCCTR